MAQTGLDCVDEIQQRDRGGVADIDHTVGGDRGQAVTLDGHIVRGAGRYDIHQQPDGADQIADIGEIAGHLAVVINVDGAVLQNCGGEFEQRHVGPAPGAIDGKEPEHRHRQAPQMGIDMAHRLAHLFTCGIDGQGQIGHISLCKRHIGVGAIDGRGGGHQQMPHPQPAGRLEHG